CRGRAAAGSAEAPDRPAAAHTGHLDGIGFLGRPPIRWPVPSLSEGGRTMKNALALAAFLVIVVAAIGWYQGWYHVKTIPAAGGHQQVTIDVDGPKIGADLGKVRDKTAELVNDAKNKGKTNTTAQSGQWVPFQYDPTPPAPQPSSGYGQSSFTPQ